MGMRSWDKSRAREGVTMSAKAFNEADISAALAALADDRS